MYVIVLLTRTLLAIVFFVAGIGKLLGGFAKSRQTLADFGVPTWLVAPISIALPCAELGTACLLLLPSTTSQIGSVSAFALLLIFNAAIVVNLAAGRRPNCNCFGQLRSSPISWSTFVRNSVLATLAGWVVWQVQRYPSPSLVQVVQGFSGKEIVVTLSVLLAFAMIGVEALVLLQFFRRMADFCFVLRPSKQD